MREQYVRWIAAAVVLLASPLLADGPETGILTGSVTDASGQVLPGVMVTLTGNRGSTEQVTDENGAYRFALVPPGEYTVTASLEGFRPSEGTVTIGAGKKMELSLKLSLETAEEITVTSEAPMVDKFNVTAGGSVEAETVLEAAPVNRGIYGPINFLPGVTNDNESLDLSSSRPTVNGASWIESAVFVDGVDTTFARYGSTRTLLPTTATTEINMEAGGQTADYGRVVGSHINVITKSGTNNWHGEGNVLYESLEIDRNYDSQPILEQKPPTTRRDDDFLKWTDEERADAEETTYEAAFGGPIVRDKAWFFLASAKWTTFYTDNTDNGDTIDNSTTTESYVAKFNFQPSEKHSIAVTGISTPIDRLFHLPIMVDRYVPTYHDISGNLYSANWNYSINSKFFSEFKVASQESNEDKLLNPTRGTNIAEALAAKQADPRFAPVPGLTTPHAPVNNFDNYIDTAPGGGWNNGWLLDNGIGTNKYPRDQANLAFTHFAGENHELKYGLDYQETKWEQNVFHNNFYTGAGFLATSPSGFASDCNFLAGRSCTFTDFNPPDVVAAGKGENESKSQASALYVYDRITVGDHWSFNVGVRLEDQQHENDIGRTVIDSTDPSPRLTAVYDIKGDGKMLITGAASRLYTVFPLEIVNTYLLDRWNGFNARNLFLFVPGAGYVLPIGTERPGTYWSYVDSGAIPEPDIKPYYRDEAILGFEWQFSSNWAFSAKGIWWELGDLVGSTRQRGPNNQIFTLTDQLTDYADTLRALGFVDRVAATPGGSRELGEQILANFEDGYREYQGLQLQMNRRYRNGWSWYNNVTFADSEANTQGDSFFNNTNDEYGRNLDTFVTPALVASCETNNAASSVQANCNDLLNHLGEPVSTLYNGGPLAVDRDFIFKSYGFKSFPLGKHAINVGGFFNWVAGQVWSLQGSVVPPSTGSATGSIENFDAITVLFEQENRRRLDDYWWVNTSVAWLFPLGGNVNGQLRVESTNVTNEQDLISVGGTGFPRNSRREFQRPTQHRFIFNVSF
jgi:hypothetical protein